MQTEERSNANEGKKEEVELDESTKADDNRQEEGETKGSVEIEGRDREGKEGKEEEEPKARESRIWNMKIKDENLRGRELSEKTGWRRTPVGRGRNRYVTRAGSIRQAPIRGARRTGTQASCTDDVVRQVDGHLTTGRQNSAKRLVHLRRNHRGLAASASRVSDGQTGTSRNQTGRNIIRRTVNLNSRGNRAGKEYITYLYDSL